MFRLKQKEALANLSNYDAFVFRELDSSEVQTGAQKRPNLTRMHVTYLYTDDMITTHIKH